jgi:hypothetical protein
MSLSSVTFPLGRKDFLNDEEDIVIPRIEGFYPEGA